MNDPVVSITLIGIVAILSQWVAWRIRLPAILILLLGGLVLGPGLGILDPDALLGDLLYPLVSLSVAFILYEGAITLRFDEIRGLERVVRNLVSVGMLVTWVIVGTASHFLMGFDWRVAMLFGAIMVVTGPTVIVPMLRTVRPTAHVGRILRWEGIIIDPLGALLAVLVFELIVAGENGGLAPTAANFMHMLIIGIALGVGGGYALGEALRQRWIPEYLHNLASLSTVFLVYTLSNFVQPESGLLTVTIMGIWLANMRGVPVEEILDCRESLSTLLVSVLFILLAARMDLEQLLMLGAPAMLVFLVLQFVARPVKVAVSTWGSTLSWRERALLAWIAPRGIVAAAISALFAFRLEDQGLAGAELLLPLTFMMIMGTVVLQSATARPVARALGVFEPEPQGLLLVGANPVARLIAGALQKAGYRVVLTDNYWPHIQAARMQGLATYYGNPMSPHADRHLDLTGLGKLLGLSPLAELNALASLRFRPEFGIGAIYTLASRGEQDGQAPKGTPERKGWTLFDREATYARLASLVGQGAEVHTTHLSDAFGYQDFCDYYDKDVTPLFAITPKGAMQVFTAEEALVPESGWTIMYLAHPKAAANARHDA